MNEIFINYTPSSEEFAFKVMNEITKLGGHCAYPHEAKERCYNLGMFIQSCRFVIYIIEDKYPFDVILLEKAKNKGIPYRLLFKNRVPFNVADDDKDKIVIYSNLAERFTLFNDLYKAGCITIK